MSRIVLRRLGAMFAATFAWLGLVDTRCEAAQVWGILPSANEIVRVNPQTGEVSGGFTPPGGALQPMQQFGGLTFAERGRTLLYQNPLTNPSDLFRLDPRTGVIRSTESMPEAEPEPEFRAGLTFHSRAGIGGRDAIFAINDGMPVQRQDGYSSSTMVDHAATQVAFAGALGGDDQGRHFVAVSQGIQEFHPFYVDLILGSFPFPQGVTTVGGLAFDGTSLYLSDATGRLFTMDPTSGAVLNSVAVEGGALIGLAARAIPEPSSCLLFGAGALLLLPSRWRSRVR